MLPEQYRADDGEMVSEPCWRLAADGFYGDTHWLQGSVLVANIVPNHHMIPLNKSAGEAMERWVSSLPLNSAGLKDEDIIEASYMMGSRADIPGMTKQQWQIAMVKLALELKAKREGSSGLRLPELQGVRPAVRPDAPPMPNATFTDPRIGGFGQQQQTVIHKPELPGRHIRKVVPGVGNLPPEGAATPA